MKNQTLPNDQNNRYKKGINALENELRSIWLEKCHTRTFLMSP